METRTLKFDYDVEVDTQIGRERFHALARARFAKVQNYVEKNGLFLLTQQDNRVGYEVVLNWEGEFTTLFLVSILNLGEKYDLEMVVLRAQNVLAEKCS